MAKFLKLIFITVVLSLNIQSGVKNCFAYSKTYNLNLKVFPTTFGYLGKTFLSPLHFDKSDWGKVGIIALGTGILYTQDTAIRNYFQQNRTIGSNSYASFFSHFGDGAYTTQVLGALYIYGEIFKKDKYKRVGMLGMESMIVNGILTGAIKLALQRPLPNSGRSYDTWYGADWSTIDDLAFPSGHTSSAFAFATIIATEFSDIKIIPVLAYTTASLTAISMVNDNLHWASDILPGAALGYFTAKKIESLQARPVSSNLTFFPMVSGESVSFICSFSF